MIFLSLNFLIYADMPVFAHLSLVITCILRFVCKVCVLGLAWDLSSIGSSLGGLVNCIVLLLVFVIFSLVSSLDLWQLLNSVYLFWFRMFPSIVALQL